MSIRAGCRSIALALIFMGGFLLPTVGWSQQRVGVRPEPIEELPAGFYVTPFFSVAELYDDNIFSSSSLRESDFISRFTPGIEAGYRSVPLTLLGRYSFDAEIFADHPELNDAQARQDASIEFRYLPTPLLTLSFDGGFVETQRTEEINVGTGIQGGRARTQSFSLSPSVTYQFDPRTTGAGGYTFTNTEVSGGVTTDTHTVNLGLNRQITPRDTGSLGYSYAQFVFDSDETITSHVVTLGWTHQLTPLTSITLLGGPRFTDGSVDPEAAASIRHQLDRGEVSFTYSRTLNIVAGETGVVKTERFAGAASYEVLRFLVVSVEPSFSKSEDEASETTRVYQMNLNATYQLAKWLFLEGSYQFSLQDTNRPGAGNDEDFDRNVFLVRLIFTNTYRVD